jgi:hypothetical protein
MLHRGESADLLSPVPMVFTRRLMASGVNGVTAIEKAQDILAHYVEPGPRDCETTIDQLMDVLDDTELI